MGGERDRIVVELSKFTNDTTEGTTAGTFTFDPDTIRQVIKNYIELADSYDQSTRDAEPMVKVGPSAQEYVSESFASKVNTSGDSYLAYCRHYSAFYLEQAQKCQDALDTYLGVEERTIIGLGQTGVGDTRPVV
ncbi:hypothetical protein [Actinophytocola sp.]|uniref:hypothetical protein n=1 Tax=Actinophytocola sp. TaxID=1872138 RepID=UPI00389ABF0A